MAELDPRLLQAIQELAKAFNAVQQTLSKVFPQGQAITSTATAGTNGAPPAQVANYMTVTGTDGVTYKVPLYKP